MLAKNKIFTTIISADYFLKLHLHHFSKIKSKKESQNSRNQGFSYYFCTFIERSGSIPLTSGSRSGRPRNMLIRIRIRIRNTAFFIVFSSQNLPKSVADPDPVSGIRCVFWRMDPNKVFSGSQISDIGSRISDPWSKTYNSLQIGSNFFSIPVLIANNYKFVIFMATLLLPLLGSGIDKNQDPEWTSRIHNTVSKIKLFFGTYPCS